MSHTDESLLEQANVGLTAYLKAERDAGRITGTYFDGAMARTVPNLRKWLLAAELDRISPNLRDGLRTAIQAQNWRNLTNAYSRDVSFGTGGIREKMGPDRDTVLRLKREGIHAPIIKGPNTINDVVLLMVSAGVAQFGNSRTPKLERVVIGFDSRVGGQDFARLIAGLFLAYDFTVYLFDEPCLYPSITYAVPALTADAGVFISASHNDFRYNGFKLSSPNGSQFNPADRKTIYEEFIRKITFADLKVMNLAEAGPERLWFLGGQPSSIGRKIMEGPHAGLPMGEPLTNVPVDHYAGRPHRIIDLPSMHAQHVQRFLVRPELVHSGQRTLKIGFSAFNGSGRKMVPRILAEAGFRDVKRITSLDAFDGMFPAFCSDPGSEQQPDPGDWRAADIAVAEFKKEYPAEWDKVDIILGTDPDADRCGLIVKVPPHQRPAYPHPGTGELRDYTLLSADEVWPLILWYRFEQDVAKFGRVQEAEKKFIVYSHTTTDVLGQLAAKHRIGVLKTWVGFAQLAAAVQAVWDLHSGKSTSGLTDGTGLPFYDEGRRKPSDSVCNRTIHSWESMDRPERCINIAALEQSNGFSLLGGPPPGPRSLGAGGHVRDKDGTLAALLVAELAQYLKDQGRSLLDWLDEKIYLDPAIGLYVTYYEPDPIDGEYEGLVGYTKKREVLNSAERLFDAAIRKKDHAVDSKSGRTELGGLSVRSATVYRTGKYDGVNWPGFPDEGYRFYFDDARRSHVTLRPSGTSNALRFHVQLFGGHPLKEDLIREKAELRETALRIVRDLRKLIGAEGHDVTHVPPVNSKAQLVNSR